MSLPPDTGAVELECFAQHTLQRLLKGERLDKRKFEDIRPPFLVREAGTCPAGSTTKSGGLLSSVMLTDSQGTCVTCSVHGLFGPPRPQSPLDGRLNVRVSAPLLPEGGFSSHGGSSNAAVSNGDVTLPLQQVEGYLLEVLAPCLDFSQLMILPGEACWILTVHVTFLNVDGGLRAAALHAAVAALHHLTLPRARLPNGMVVEKRELQLACLPVACTFGILGGSTVRLLADTSAIEEHVSDGVLTVALDARGNLVHLQQLGRYPLLPEVLLAAANAWQVHAPAVRKALTSV